LSRLIVYQDDNIKLGVVCTFKAKFTQRSRSKNIDTIKLIYCIGVGLPEED